MTTTLVVGALLLAACGGDDDTTPATNTGPTATAAPAEPATEVAEPTTEPTVGSTPDEPPDTRQRLSDAGAPSIELAIVEPGPHPMLEWDAVAGADEYWLVVLDGDGVAYWSWTGEGTTVRFGGGDNPELNQTAVLYEPMTASVAAVAGGTIIAISDVTALEPAEG